MFTAESLWEGLEHLDCFAHFADLAEAVVRWLEETRR